MILKRKSDSTVNELWTNRRVVPWHGRFKFNFLWSPTPNGQSRLFILLIGISGCYLDERLQILQVGSCWLLTLYHQIREFINLIVIKCGYVNIGTYYPHKKYPINNIFWQKRRQHAIFNQYVRNHIRQPSKLWKYAEAECLFHQEKF